MCRAPKFTAHIQYVTIIGLSVLTINRTFAHPPLTNTLNPPFPCFSPPQGNVREASFLRKEPLELSRKASAAALSRQMGAEILPRSSSIAEIGEGGSGGGDVFPGRILAPGELERAAGRQCRQPVASAGQITKLGAIDQSPQFLRFSGIPRKTPVGVADAAV